MLNQKERDSNTVQFYNLLRSTKREGIEDLIKYLESTDFEVAPASTKYHGAFEGGLCAHSLMVFEILTKMLNDYIEFKNLEFPNELGESHDEMMNSAIIVALLHDISKVNHYEKTFNNKKIYSPDGSKWDENGRFDWKSVPGYKMRDEEEQFVIGNHEETSEFIIRQFIPLRISESAAIMHHHGGLGWDSVKPEVMTKVYNKYTLALLLHQADLLAAYKFV